MRYIIIAFLLVACSVASYASDLYPALINYSFEGIEAWAQGRLQFGATTPPTASASNGDIFINTATPGIKMLISGAWVDIGRLPTTAELEGSNFYAGTDQRVLIGSGVKKAPYLNPYSVVIGANSCASQTGYGNVAIGNNVMESADPGNCNTVIGHQAMQTFGAGSQNTTIGYGALNELISGSDNTVIGYNARRSASAINQSVIIGDSATSLYDDTVNEIIIGYGAIGAGSNTVVLGNDNIVNTYLKGQVHVATPTSNTVAANKAYVDNALAAKMDTDANNAVLPTARTNLDVYSTTEVDAIAADLEELLQQGSLRMYYVTATDSVTGGRLLSVHPEMGAGSAVVYAPLSSTSYVQVNAINRLSEPGYPGVATLAASVIKSVRYMSSDQTVGSGRSVTGVNELWLVDADGTSNPVFVATSSAYVVLGTEIQRCQADYTLVSDVSTGGTTRRFAEKHYRKRTGVITGTDPTITVYYGGTHEGIMSLELDSAIVMTTDARNAELPAARTNLDVYSKGEVDAIASGKAATDGANIASTAFTLNLDQSLLGGESGITTDSADLRYAALNGTTTQNFSVKAPTADDHAATKKYVDDNSGGTPTPYAIPNWTTTDWYAENASSGLFLVAMLDGSSAAPASWAYPGYSATVAATDYAGAANLPTKEVALIPRNIATIGLFNPDSQLIRAGVTASTTDGLWLDRNCHIVYKNKLIMIPATNDNIGIYDWSANTFSQGAVATTTDNAWQGAALMPNGLICLVPNGNVGRPIGLYNPANNSFVISSATMPAAQQNYQSNKTIVAPNNKVYFMPGNTSSASMGIYDPVADTFDIIQKNTDGLRGGNYQVDSCLLPNGKILSVPLSENGVQCYVYLYDPVANTWATGSAFLTTGAAVYDRCMLAANGKVALINREGSTIDYYDPTTDTISLGADNTLLKNSSDLWLPPILMRDGNFLYVPKATRTTLGVFYTDHGDISKWVVTSPWLK